MQSLPPCTWLRAPAWAQGPGPRGKLPEGPPSPRHDLTAEWAGPTVASSVRSWLLSTQQKEDDWGRASLPLAAETKLESLAHLTRGPRPNWAVASVPHLVSTQYGCQVQQGQDWTTGMGLAMATQLWLLAERHRSPGSTSAAPAHPQVASPCGPAAGYSLRLLRPSGGGHCQGPRTGEAGAAASVPGSGPRVRKPLLACTMQAPCARFWGPWGGRAPGREVKATVSGEVWSLPWEPVG